MASKKRVSTTTAEEFTETDDHFPSFPYKYLEMRKRRMAENSVKMRILGLKNQTNHLTRNLALKRIHASHAQQHNPLPPRQSSRLSSRPPVCYEEPHPVPIGETSSPLQIHIPRGPKPEIYTEDHEKLLGHSKTEWAVRNGKRIYNHVKGQTCHQCRQKTLGRHTHCSACYTLKGQLCGDCLYSRYGENVVEANQDPNWVCPVCRGICNCSFCRKKNGWVPTGNLYPKAISLGYKSVAHYLIQTHRSQSNSMVSNSDNVIQDEEEKEMEEEAVDLSAD